MRLILVCHGEANSEAITQTGNRRAELIAVELASILERTFPAEAVYVGTSPAAQNTARLVATALGLPSPREHHAFGARAKEAGPDVLEGIQTLAWQAVEEMQSEHSADSTIVHVNDELPVRLLVCQALSLPLTNMLNFQIGPGSLTTLEFRILPQRRTILAGLNERCHLGM